MYFGNIEDVDPCSERENSMHARVTIAQRNRSEMTDEAINIFRESVMPQQKQQPGYKGTLLLVDRTTGKAIVFSLWQTEAEMKASEQNDHYRQQIAKFAHLFTAPSTQEVFAVSFHDLG